MREIDRCFITYSAIECKLLEYSYNHRREKHIIYSLKGFWNYSGIRLKLF